MMRNYRLIGDLDAGSHIGLVSKRVGKSHSLFFEEKIMWEDIDINKPSEK